VRDIEFAAAEGDDDARLSIAVFAHRVKKYIGAYAAAMGGLDGVILTGGIGENSVTLRQRILQRLDFLGLQLDEDRNHDARVDPQQKVACISSPLSRVAALVVKTNEELMIAKQTASLLEQQTRLSGSRTIPIAVSGRHLHLDKETFAKLFGADAKPTHHADLSQPGQFACKEKVTLVGPRNRLENVRLLGPLRSKNQVEVSRTDEYLLGVDAPVRDSGRVKDSAPITLEGPEGTVHLSEGLICARRHIHMHPEDAEHFGVNNKDTVEVAISGGPRDLTFGDVLVRVSHGYRLEMHIDTDEANAAELDRSSDGELVYEGIEGYVASVRARRT
jgi:acetate kinase